jgi:hypothetical protein
MTRAAQLREAQTAQRSERLARGDVSAPAEPTDFVGGFVVVMLFACLGAAVGLVGMLVGL